MAPGQSPLGKEIFRACDERGTVIVYEAGLRRTLSFTGSDEQSAMSLADPARLEYAYTQAMMLGTLLVEGIRNVLLLGLGGGSLARAIVTHFPGCHVTAVESRRLVVAVARRFFALPSDPRLEVRIGDAGSFVQNPLGFYDLIFADLYGPSGMDPEQTADDFLRCCRSRLDARGILVVNLWNTEYRASGRYRSALIRAFDGQFLQMAVQGGNSIGFGFAGHPPRTSSRRLFDRAQTLGYRMGIPLQRLARGLWSQNIPVLLQGRPATDPAARV